MSLFSDVSENKIAMRRTHKSESKLEQKQIRNIERLKTKVEAFMQTPEYEKWKQKTERVRSDGTKKLGPETEDLLSRVDTV